ncbi:unnamed protein product [Gongylonema pulchrum]|uniref:14-3-3 domain-containing protein n=1 Tax=Gongylonema pulchrum TaxID=637853 RepID=A0A3P7PRG3_9BILA|nr:unnamed protein product [Gongylonema pulchrum]
MSTVVDIRHKVDEAYDQAIKLADKKFKVFHPLRLGLMINMSIYYYEVKCDRLKALQLALQVS